MLLRPWLSRIFSASVAAAAAIHPPDINVQPCRHGCFTIRGNNTSKWMKNIWEMTTTTTTVRSPSSPLLHAHNRPLTTSSASVLYPSLFTVWVISRAPQCHCCCCCCCAGAVSMPFQKHDMTHLIHSMPHFTSWILHVTSHFYHLIINKIHIQHWKVGYWVYETVDYFGGVIAAQMASAAVDQRGYSMAWESTLQCERQPCNTETKWR